MKQNFHYIELKHSIIASTVSVHAFVHVCMSMSMSMYAYIHISSHVYRGQKTFGHLFYPSSMGNRDRTQQALLSDHPSCQVYIKLLVDNLHGISVIEL